MKPLKVCTLYSLSACVAVVLALLLELDESFIEPQERTAGQTHWLSCCPPHICVSFFLCFLSCMYSFVKQNRDALSRRSSINSIQSPWVITLLLYLLSCPVLSSTLLIPHLVYSPLLIPHLISSPLLTWFLVSSLDSLTPLLIPCFPSWFLVSSLYSLSPVLLYCLVSFPFLLWFLVSSPDSLACVSSLLSTSPNPNSLSSSLHCESSEVKCWVAFMESAITRCLAGKQTLTQTSKQHVPQKCLHLTSGQISV